MPMRRSLTAFLVPTAIALTLSLSACAPFPEVAAQPSDTGPYPTLLPMDELLAQADAP